MTNAKLLEKITPFYSIMGELDESALQGINLMTNEFGAQCKRDIVFMEKFKEHVLRMEGSFDSGWGSNEKLNNYFFQYEKNILSHHLLSLGTQSKGLIKNITDQSMASSQTS